MNVKEIAVRAGVTAAEAFLAGILAVGLTNLTLDGIELAALTGAGAGLSVIYNAARQWLDRPSGLDAALRADRDRQDFEGYVAELRDGRDASDAGEPR